MRTSIDALWKPSAALMLCVLAILLTSCTTTTPIGAIDTSDINRICSVWKYVSYSSRDTPETVLEIRAANAAKDGFCEEKP